MKATIWHNPKCSTSRKTLELLRAEGAQVTIVDYLKDPPSRTELARLYQRAGMSPAQGLRSKEPLARTLGLVGGEADDSVILDAMAEHPILIERPIVETEKGVRVARPVEKVLEIL